MKDNSVIHMPELSGRMAMPSGTSAEIMSASCFMGFWATEIPKDSRPRMYANAQTLYLLGFEEGTDISPEALHDYWIDRVDSGCRKEVNGYISAILDGKEAEIEYYWDHPKLGRIKVHSGGKRSDLLGDDIHFHGYHRNVSDVVRFQGCCYKHDGERAFTDSILASLAKKMYSIVITVNLKMNEFTFIGGAGMEQAVEELNAAKTYRDCYNCFYYHALPEFKKKLCSLISLDYLLNLDLNEGHVGSVEFLASLNGKSYWREVSVYIGNDSAGNRIANILLRNIDDIKREQAAKQIELDSVNARMRVLAEITKKMYGFNITVDLRNGNFTVLTGVGMEYVTSIIQSTNYYPTMLERMLAMVDEEYVKPLRALLGFDFLAASEVSQSSIGTETFSASLNGKRYWHEITVFRMNDEGGNPTANILCRDVTAIMEAAELQQREERKQRFNDIIMSQITRSLYGYNITVNLNTQQYTIIEGNGTDEAIQILKDHETFQEALDAKIKIIEPSFVKSFLDLVSLKNLRAASERKHAGFLNTLTYKTIIGDQPAWHEASVFIGVNEDGEPIANILGRDVTDTRKKQDEQLESERAVNAARSYFFSTVSHDIRTPLNAIIGYAELLKSGIEDRSEREQALDSVVTSGKALMHLINDVLDLSKLESGKMEIVNEPTDTFSIINETLSAFTLVCSKKKISLVRDIHEMPRLMLDPQRIRQLLFNLIGNAVKFTTQGSVTVTATYDDRELEISVKDTGIGIKQSELSHIMMPYVQVHGAGRNGGTGLGLAICNQLALQMGGALSVESEYGKGSVFTITIPHVLVANDEDEAHGRESGNVEAAEAGQSIADLPQNILIVDDSVVNLKVLRAMLRKLNIKNIHQASSAKEALEMLRTITVDLILTDVWMPGMSGVQFAETLRMTERAAGRDPSPICAVTADVESVRSNTSAKFDGALLEPIVIDDLVRLLRKFCKNRGVIFHD